MLDIKEILEDIKNGMTQSEIAKKNNVSRQAVNDKLTRYCKKQGIEIPKTEKKDKYSKEKIIERYKELKSKKDVAKELKLNTAKVGEIINNYYEENNLELLKKTKEDKKYTTDVKKEIYDLWKNGKTQEEIAEIYNTCQPAISKVLNEYIKENNIEKQNLDNKLSNKQLYLLVINGVSNKYITKKYKTSDEKINKKIKEYCKENNLDYKEVIKIRRDNLKKFYELNKQVILKKEILNHNELISEELYQIILDCYNQTTINIKVTFPKEEMIKLAKEGKTQEEIAKIANCSSSLVGKRLYDYYHALPKTKQLSLTDDKIIDLFERGYSTTKIGEMAICSDKLIQKKLKEHYNSFIKPLKYTKEEIKDIVISNDFSELYKGKKISSLNITIHMLKLHRNDLYLYYLDKNNINRYNLENNIVDEQKRINKEKTLIKLPKSYK